MGSWSVVRLLRTSSNLRTDYILNHEFCFSRADEAVVIEVEGKRIRWERTAFFGNEAS